METCGVCGALKCYSRGQVRNAIWFSLSTGVQYFFTILTKSNLQRTHCCSVFISVDQKTSYCSPILCLCEFGLWHLPKTQLAQCSTGPDCMTQCSCSSSPWYQGAGLSIWFDWVDLAQFQGCLFLCCSEWFIWHTLACCTTLRLKGGIVCRWQQYQSMIYVCIHHGDKCFGNILARLLWKKKSVTKGPWTGMKDRRHFKECDQSLMTTATLPQGWGLQLKPALQ